MKKQIIRIIIGIVAAYILIGIIYNLVIAFSQRSSHPDFLETPDCEPFFGCEN